VGIALEFASKGSTLGTSYETGGPTYCIAIE